MDKVIDYTAVSELDLKGLWSRIRAEAEAALVAEPLLAHFIRRVILEKSSLADSLSYRFGQKLASNHVDAATLESVAREAYAAEPSLAEAALRDVRAVYTRDPASHRFIQPVLFFKGFQAIEAYRIGHWLWQGGRQDMAYFVQMRTSEAFGVDIHPGARLGTGLMIDHAHSIVIGETAVVGDDVSMLHSVTLGGTGKEHGDRHPKIGDGVLIGAGAKILGNIRVGSRSRIASGSVVLSDVPPCTTVAGVPARVVGPAGCEDPAEAMEQRLDARA